MLVSAGFDERCAAAFPVTHILCASNQLQPTAARYAGHLCSWPYSSHITAADEAIGGTETSLPVDVLLCIGVIIGCLTLPFAIVLKLHRLAWGLVMKVASLFRSGKVLPIP